MCGGERLRYAATAALPHINLLLAVYSGAALATSARLKWDPSTYMLLRELLPAEYCAAAVALPALALVQLLLAHLALAASLSCRGLLYVYAALTMALVIGEIAFAVWAWQQVDKWLRSPDAVAAAELQRELGEHLWPLLRALERLYPLPSKLSDLIAEVKADLPRNGYVAGAAATLLLLLQMAGAAAAFLRAGRSSAQNSNASRKRASSGAHPEQEWEYQHLAPHAPPATLPSSSRQHHRH